MNLKEAEALMKANPGAAVRLLKAAVEVTGCVPVRLEKKIDMEAAIGKRGCKLFTQLQDAVDEFLPDAEPGDADG